jgi:methionine synthase II (cobalamin-independent)
VEKSEVTEREKILARVREALKVPAHVPGAHGNAPLKPDCGLKTRRWEEVIPALKNLVAAARSALNPLHRSLCAQSDDVLQNGSLTKV